MNLAQLSDLGSPPSENGRAALASLLTTSPVVGWLDRNSAFQLESTESSWTPANAQGGVKTRGMNEGYTPSALGVEAKQNDTLRFHGDSIRIDESLLADARNGRGNVQEYIAARMPEEFEKFTYGFEELLMNGDGAADNTAPGNPLKLKGLRYLLNGVDDLPGYPGIKGCISAALAQYSGVANAAFLDLTDKDNYPKLLKMIQLVKLLVPGANGLIMPPQLHAIICDAAYGKVMYSETVNDFGITVPKVHGLEIVPALDGSIKLNEPDGSVGLVAQTTSMYVARAGENALSLITNSGLSYKEYDHASKKAGAEEWEVRSKWRARKRNCVLRIRHIKVQPA